MIQTKIHRKHHFTPLRYPGGKTSLFQFFDKVVTSHGWKDTIYIEPYAGGAGAALSLLLLNKVKSVVINDRDPAVYSFWKASLDYTDEFIEKIEKTPVTVLEWQKQKQIYKKADKSEMLELGFATFFLNRTNRSGVLNAGPIGGKKQENQWKINARYKKENLIAKIQLISKNRGRIKVTNCDGLELIKEYSQDKRSFFYIDPPYFKKGADLYLNAFKYEDHKSLASALNKNQNTKWLLSYDNEPVIRRLYPRRHQEEFSLRYSVNTSSKSGSEVMIFSDTIDKTLL